MDKIVNKSQEGKKLKKGRVGILLTGVYILLLVAAALSINEYQAKEEQINDLLQENYELREELRTLENWIMATKEEGQ